MLLFQPNYLLQSTVRKTAAYERMTHYIGCIFSFTLLKFCTLDIWAYVKELFINYALPRRHRT